MAQEVTIHGYTEGFAVNPAVEIYKDGAMVSKIERNGTLKLEIAEPCNLKFKCSFRSSECHVHPGDHVVLSFNRMTGSLETKVSDEKNLQSVMKGNEKKDNNNVIWAIIIIAGLLILSAALGQ